MPDHPSCCREEKRLKTVRTADGGGTVEGKTEIRHLPRGQIAF
jgi:hypothetical protein